MTGVRAMSRYTAIIEWQRRDGEAFDDNRYSRAHRWTFDGGTTVPGSSSPQVVPVPYSDEKAVDPEEAFVASLSSCHMLWFLHQCADAGLVVERYLDEAEGTMGRNARGGLAMTVVILHPRVRFAGTSPDPTVFERLHRQAHEQCFIANSVHTDVRCEPVIEP